MSSLPKWRNTKTPTKRREFTGKNFAVATDKKATIFFWRFRWVFGVGELKTGNWNWNFGVHWEL